MLSVHALATIICGAVLMALFEMAMFNVHVPPKKPQIADSAYRPLYMQQLNISIFYGFLIKSELRMRFVPREQREGLRALYEQTLVNVENKNSRSEALC